MPKYGIIQNGELVLSDVQSDGYKPIVYSDIPEFDQVSQYIQQGNTTELNDHIEVGYEIKELEVQDESTQEPASGEFIEYSPRNEQRAQDMTIERVSLLEDVVLTLMME
ncbi:hypothetical protein [Bacillus benzoevorans]|uniref:Uncharacterized protein n=1 Tax=Bacillus benzoevorans TaxID=1456 RepID=A0A7X0LW87_9BACI|nr:hypothetical protein [Bacillus benzoevorans]MBB6446443.1 hypothetical protein [Bacillus benzoevorans]